MEFILVSIAKPSRDAVALAGRTRRFLESSLVDDQERISVDIQDGNVHVVAVDGPKPYEDQVVERTSDRIAAVRGYVTTPGWSPAHQLVDVERGTIDSPGGIYSAIVADPAAGRVSLWTSHGNVEGLFWAEGDDAWFGGTSSLAVHCLSQPDHRVRLDSTWCRHVIVSGSTLSDDTPFVGTRYVPARRRLVFTELGPRVEEHPVRIEAGPTDVSFHELADECRRAVSPAAEHAGTRLSLSGGKDSRTALALLLDAGIRVESFTSGLDGRGEVIAAQAVAKAAGIPHAVEQKVFAAPDQFWPSVFANLRESDGLLNENRHLVHVTRPDMAGTVEVHGQAHHLRGGFMTRPRYTDDEMVRQSAYGRFTKAAIFCDPAIGDEVRSQIDAYLDNLVVPNRGLKLYWMYGDLRMARWLQPGLQKRRKQQLLIWPFLDERVLRVAAGLSVHDRAHEIAQYELIARAAPSLAKLPLFESQWRFDQRAGRRKVRRRWRKSRMMAVVDNSSISIGPQTASTIPLLLPHFRTSLLELPSGPAILDLLGPEWRPVVNGEYPKDLIADAGRFPVFSFMWRVLALAAVMSGEWLPARIELAR